MKNRTKQTARRVASLVTCGEKCDLGLRSRQNTDAGCLLGPNASTPIHMDHDRSAYESLDIPVLQ